MMNSTTTTYYDYYNTMMQSSSSSSPLDLLLHARIPLLDAYLSEESQSVVVETVFWGILYLMYSAVFSELVRALMSRMSFWQTTVKTKIGIFCWNGQDDIVLLVVLAAHHLTAGYMCWLGVQNHDANIWRHGYLLEVGFEVADIAALFLNLYPHKHENLKPEGKAGLIFHHVPGILIGGMILNSGLHHNEHVREIAFWLLVGAFGSCMGGCYIHSCDLDTQMNQATLGMIVNLAFFMYCRFYVFPMESLRVLQDVNDDPLLKEEPFVLTGLQTYGILMSCFNTIVISDGIPRTYRYVLRALDGVTQVETLEVPLSREDRWKQQQQQQQEVAKSVKKDL